MMLVRIFPGLLLAVIPLIGDSGSDTAWVMLRNEGNVQVFSQAPAPGRPLGIRGVSRAAVRFEVLATVLLDIPAYPEWMEELKEARIVEKASADDFLLYNYYDLPWPFADRDIYVRVTIVKDMEHGLARARIVREESPDRPPLPGVVRIPAMEGILEIRYIDRRTTEGSFTEWFDMGGSVPAWLKNAFARRIPSSVLQLVAEACTKPEYRARGAASSIRKQLEEAIAQGYLKP